MRDVVLDGAKALLIAPADAPSIEQAALRLAHFFDMRWQLGQAAQQSM
jgi:hypothetical protein